MALTSDQPESSYSNEFHVDSSPFLERPGNGFRMAGNSAFEVTRWFHPPKLTKNPPPELTTAGTEAPRKVHNLKEYPRTSGALQGSTSQRHSKQNSGIRASSTDQRQQKHPTNYRRPGIQAHPKCKFKETCKYQTRWDESTLQSPMSRKQLVLYY